MEIRFTKHAIDKFDTLKKHGDLISQKKVIDTLLAPEATDSESRAPLFIAQSALDQTHVLRVIYRREGENIAVITIYPGRKTQYGKK